MTTSIEKIQNITDVTYSDEQERILDHQGGMCILACAGSGKTTVLTHLIVKRIMDKEITDCSKLLVTTYSVAGREELEVRVNGLLALLGIAVKVEIRTLHSAYRHMLQRIGIHRPLIEGWKRTEILRAGARERDLRLDDETIQKMDSLLSYQINNMLTDEALFNHYTYDIDVAPDDYSAISRYYTNEKNNMGVMDFDDMQLLVYTHFKTDVNARELFRSIWTHFYIDEFQDVSKIQFEILKMQLVNEQNLVVIGDDDQCVYAWRGADPSIIQNICGYYDINRFILSTNYRCGGKIVKHAAVAIANNTHRSDKTMNPSNDGGRIVVKNMPNSMYEISHAACEHVLNLINEGVQPKDIAVLCRNNVHGVILDALLQPYIQAKTSKDIRFGTHHITRELRTAVELSKGDMNFHHAKHLWKFVKYLKASEANMVSAVMRDSCCTLKVALKSILTNMFGMFIQDDVFVLPMVNNQYMKFKHTMNDKAVNSMLSFYKLIMGENEIENAIACIELYLECTVDFLYKSEDVKRNLYGIADLVQSWLEEGMYTYEMNMCRADTYAEAEVEVTRDCVTISTMHGSKGKEWQHVIILGDDNVAFPSFYSVKQLIVKGIPLRQVADYIEQERRLHYVAMTRAKIELRIYTTGTQMSVFLAEALGIIEKYDSINSHVINIALDGQYNPYHTQLILEAYATYAEAS